MASFFNSYICRSRPVASPFRALLSTATKPVSSTAITAKKSNLPQSPWKMRFLVMLARDAWVPDALAQLKFSPKHRSDDVAKIVQRAVSIARINYDAIPEELFVKEIFVTKGTQTKKLRYMGRGRTGFGRIRSTHVTVVVDKVNFDEKIAKAETSLEKSTWTKRLAFAAKQRAVQEANKTTGTANAATASS